MRLRTNRLRPRNQKKRPEKKSQKKNDQWPGFVSPQLAFLVDDPPSSSEWTHEIKFDGYRLQPHLKNKDIKLFTRGAHNWSEKFPALSRALSKLPCESAILDGEAVVMDEKGRSDFGKLQTALSAKDDRDIRLYLFDLLYLNGEDLREKPLKERKELLKDLLKKCPPPLFYSEDVSEDGEHFFKMACQYDLEGIVSKDSLAPYRSGRNRLWCKAKCKTRQEFIICGYSEGKGGRSSVFGSLLLGVYDQIKNQKKLRYVGKVGTGFDSKTLSEIKKKMAPLLRQKSPIDLKCPKEKNVKWIKPELVAEVSFSEWTSDKVLRVPVFLGLREDKAPEDIVMEKAAHISPAEYKKVAHEIPVIEEAAGEDIALTHPEKILFSKEKITKQMIADYYKIAAPSMLPLIKDRPLSLVRCPHGGEKQCFYQKHPGPGAIPKNFKSFKVREKSDTNVYVALDSYYGLKQLVQMNAFEMHTWNCHYQTLMHPDQFVLDFDPDPSVSFKTVIKAVLEMKDILDQLKLKSFVKLTGGKGVHIHVPVEPVYTWDEIKSFSKALADEMVSRHPKDFISTMSKEARKGKIFVDYLRNGYGATAVAPYALRAKAQSAVAMPIEWSELAKIKSPDQFTLKKAVAKIKARKSDPWKNFFKVKQRITLLE